MLHRPRLVYRSECRPCRAIARLVWLLSLGTFTLVPDPDCHEPALAFGARRLTGFSLELAMTGLVVLHLLWLAILGLFLYRAGAGR